MFNDDVVRNGECVYSDEILTCDVCRYESRKGEKNIILIRDSEKSIKVCKRCFLITLKEFMKTHTTIIRDDYRIHFDNDEKVMSFERFVRFYYIDYIQNRKRINLYV